MSIDQYWYNVIWSSLDKEYVALCAEFPSLSYLASTHAEALAGIRQRVAETVAELIADGEPVPRPISP